MDRKCRSFEIQVSNLKYKLFIRSQGQLCYARTPSPHINYMHLNRIGPVGETILASSTSITRATRYWVRVELISGQPEYDDPWLDRGLTEAWLRLLDRGWTEAGPRLDRGWTEVGPRLSGRYFVVSTPLCKQFAERNVYLSIVSSATVAYTPESLETELIDHHEDWG